MADDESPCGIILWRTRVLKMRVWIPVLVTLLVSCTAFGQSYSISTFAGGGRR